ncbi:FAD-binding oxidoreductase [Deinococcus sp. KSM4-11]|uniref:FAD-binding oxidoreductase n=1 Tax=Deinococcus sp. KSM4-11 TaxID=2568654 RepID=UPI0010A36A21|nr:FAD-binding oxidoreductase [Deinococcus sp. KSM4-11]THF86737.1 FAD-binding oxidoreductase [Deinococcus sp. KSM4-11]
MNQHQDAFNYFSATFDGTIVHHGQAGYDDIREVWNAAGRDVTPALVVRPADAHAVAHAVRFAAGIGLPLAVRSGGHSPAAFGTVQDGLVIDLTALKAINIDPDTRRVRVEPGLTWGEVAAALHEHGLAITAGDVATVGVGGLTQGGGIGWFVRRYGLAIDRLRSAQLVTATGDLLTVSDTEHPEVFWALRGAGANLGVITALEFESHPAGMVYGGLLAFDASDPAEGARLMTTFARLAHEAPEALTTQGLFMAAPPAPFVPPHLVGKTLFAVASVYSGDLAWGDAVLAPFRAMGTVGFDLTGPMPYPAIFQLTADAAQRGFRHAIRSGFLNALDDHAAQQLAAEVQLMQPGQIVQLRPLGGEMARVPNHATAFSHRTARFLLMVSQAVPEAGLDALAWSITNRMFAPFEAQVTGLYGNFASGQDIDPARTAFTSAHRERIARVKTQLDPHNVFARNVNIRPQVAEPVTA